MILCHTAHIHLTRVRDEIMVRYIAKMLVAMVYLRNMALIGSLFPLVFVSFEEI